MDWQTVRIQGAGKTAQIHNEAVFTNLLEKEISVDPVPEPGAAEDEAKGNRLAGLPPLPAGEYVVEVKAEDGGWPVISSLAFEVTAPAELGWNYRNDFQLALKPNQEAYAPGETAEILVERHSAARRWLRWNARKSCVPSSPNWTATRRQFAFRSSPVMCPTYLFRNAVRGSDASPHQIKEPEYRIGFCELSVLDRAAGWRWKSCRPAPTICPDNRLRSRWW